MPEDEIDRIVDRMANRIGNNPREPLSDHQLANLLSFNAKHARFFEAKLMEWAAARLEALHAVLTAEPTRTKRYASHGSRKSWDAKGGRGRPPQVRRQSDLAARGAEPGVVVAAHRAGPA